MQRSAIATALAAASLAAAAFVAASFAALPAHAQEAFKFGNLSPLSGPA